MKIKIGDKVKVISGKDRGRSGKVTKVLPKEDKVIVENINIHKRHEEGAGGVIEVEMPIHVSNVQLIDPEKGEVTRVGYIFEDGKKVRVTKKSGTKLS